MKEIKITRTITNRTSDAFNRYLTDISQIPMITAEREAELANLIHQGGKAGDKAREELVRANLRFVISVAKRYEGRGMTLEDLVNEGNIGLLQAADHFDETRGFKFISYAVCWIRQSIMVSLSKNNGAVRLPCNRVILASRIRELTKQFLQEHLRKPTVEELADLTGESESIISSILGHMHKAASLDESLAEDSDTTHADMLAAGDEVAPDRTVDEESLRTDIHMVMSHVLNTREQRVISMSFGLDGHQYGPEEIGSRLGLTRERVRQLRERSIQKIRESGGMTLLARYIA